MILYYYRGSGKAMDNKTRESLRKAVSIANNKSKNGQNCEKHNDCMPQFRIKHINDIEKGERILNEKILGNV